MSTKQSSRAKKGIIPLEKPAPNKPINGLYDELKKSYNDTIFALRTYEGIRGRIAASPETVKRIKDINQFNNNVAVLELDIKNLSDQANALFAKHKDYSGDAQPEQIMHAFGILEGYLAISVRNQEATAKIATEITIQLNEAEHILLGELKALREQYPEAAAATDAEMQAEDDAVQKKWDESQATNPEVVTDVTFVETDSKTVH